MSDVDSPTPDDVPVLALRLLSRHHGRMVLLREKASSRRWIASDTYVEDVTDCC